MTRQVNFTFDESDTVCKGYEIHMGRSVPAGGFSPSPLNKLEDGREDGYRNGRSVWEHIFMAYLTTSHL